MIWKAFIVAFLATEQNYTVLAEYQVTEEQRAQFKEILKQQCKKNGAEDKVDQVEAAVRTFMDCAKSLFDPDTVKKEIEAAKPKGEIDEVFKKYCDKSPAIKACIHALTNGVSPCVDAGVREQVPAINNATNQLLDFVCYQEGNRIALFIAENGTECFQSKANEIRECAQKLKESIPSVEAAKAQTLTEQCKKFDETSSCIVKGLEGCPTPTPANIVESLFRYVRNGSPCKDK